MSGNNNNSVKIILIFIVIAALVFGGVFAVITLTSNVGKTASDVSQADAVAVMERLYKKIRVNTLAPTKGMVDLGEVNIADSLPDIDKYPPQVDNKTADFVEIFSSTEKATVSSGGADTDRWLVDMAIQFNNARITIDGQPVSVRIRGIASGLGMDYISSGKYVPDAFSPSNELWGDALKSMNIPAALVEKRLTGNVAGIVLSKSKYSELTQKYGAISVKTITEAVVNNELQMGYTNPFASSTGANYLISTLYSFDPLDPLNETTAQEFTKFQSNIPYVAYTTLQMKDSAKSGMLDGFVFEYQQLMNSPDIKNDYVFTPFGVRHDSPVYELGNLSPLKKEILRQFIDFCKTEEAQRAAAKYGFNGYDDYATEFTNMNGDNLIQAQKLWKEKKSGDRDIIAVFVADVSGSMEGEPLNKLKESLLSGSKYIGNDCSVGLITFSNDVNIALPIGKFDLNQRSLFVGAVGQMTASGGTAMFDAIVVASKMLMEQKANNPNAKLMLFVLTDGDTNQGNSLNDCRNMIAGLQIPIYTIGYNANVASLAQVSSINEAASINADTDDVVYKIQNLFNAEM
ncbi:MAG: VWA domain-containing protein [Oscillospiraceae bacterium]|nr:VWA domain-containing protein [Oscillospiraceae bacterium]